jgi:peptide/nickel transport system permease protein
LTELTGQLEPKSPSAASVVEEELAAKGASVYTASQWRLMWWKFRKHKVAVWSLALIANLYVLVILCELIAPYVPEDRNIDLAYSPPQRLHWIGADGFHLRPFVYNLSGVRHPETRRRLYAEDTTTACPVRFFVLGSRYDLWGLIPMRLHLFGVGAGGTLHLLGTDSLGRDLFTRLVYGARISMTIGLIGVALTFFFGLTIGAASGYFGGMVDHLIQRLIEVIQSFPTIPLWMALSAALPASWTPIQTYFGIILVLSLIGWTGLARVVRGKILSLREEDYATAALLSGASTWRIMWRHLLPGFTSNIIVGLTLQLPNVVLGETALSYLGLGLRRPVVSWGVLLYDAQNVQAVAQQPWLLSPAVLVVVMVLAFNFVGDGLRDAADPYVR